MEWSFRVFWDFFGVCYNGKRDAQKNILFHVRFRTLRYSKASKIKYYPALTVGWDYMGKLFLQHMWIYGSCYRQLRLEAW